MPKPALSLSDVDSIPLLATTSTSSPPPYSDRSPKASPNNATMLVHTPYSPGYYDDDYDEYFAPRAPRKSVFARVAKLLKWPLILSLCLSFCITFSLLTSHLVRVNAPATYAKQALNLTVISVSVDDVASDGLHAHVVAEVSFDSAKVRDRPTRVLGRLATSVMRKAEVAPTYMIISRVNSGIVGRASIPNIVVDIRDNHVTPIDFVSTVHELTSVAELAKLVQEYLAGTLDEVVFRGDADLPLRSGVLPLGTHHVSHDVKLEHTASSIPFAVSEFKFGQLESGVQVRVAASARNPYPVNIVLPALDWIVEAATCGPRQLVSLAVARSEPITITPKGTVDLRVTSDISGLPRPFTQPCADSDDSSSAMDRYLRQYLAGETITVHVRGKSAQPIPGFPPWFSDLLSVVSIPVPVPGRKSSSDDKLVRSYGLSRVKITLPPRVPGETPIPRISALVNAVIELPKELDFRISVDKLKGVSDMSYLGEKFGVLEITEWTPAQSFYTPEGYIEVVAEIKDLPIDITDQTVFKKLLQKMFFAGEANVDVQGTIDVGLDTPVGEFAIRHIPAEGTFPLGLSSSHVIGLHTLVDFSLDGVAEPDVAVVTVAEELGKLADGMAKFEGVLF